MKGNSSEMRTAVAALFLGEGKDALTEDEALLSISVKRRWFSPELAKKFMENALSSGLIKRDGGHIRPSFEYSDVEIPYGYYPDDSVLHAMDEKTEDVSADALSMDYPFTDEVKSLIYLMRKGEDIRDKLDTIEKKLMEN